nr:MAG TPA: hypothetical protein [Caudoviricetes sp.]
MQVCIINKINNRHTCAFCLLFHLAYLCKYAIIGTYREGAQAKPYRSTLE